MKLTEYYINNGKGKDYQKVKGYIETVTDSTGFSLTIGYDKRNEFKWCATEIHTGMGIRYCNTRKACIEWVHENIDAIGNAIRRTLANDRYYIKYIQPFVNR